MSAFSHSYDYRCPFAKNIHLHVVAALSAGAEHAVTFVPWSLSQGHRAEGAPDVWDDPTRDGDLLALAASVAVRDLQPERFLDAHAALFRARHERGVRLVTREEVAAVLAPLGVELGPVFDDVDSRRPHKVIGAAHQEFEAYQAFGVPTFVLGGDATFVRYMDPPTDDPTASVELLDTLIGLMEHRGALNEFKHTTVPY
ncbi:MAG: DsbA family protein [Acidimicrobiales bacterium]